MRTAPSCTETRRERIVDGSVKHRLVEAALAWPASGARVDPHGRARIDETGEPQPSRWLPGSAGARSSPDLPDEEGAGPAGLPCPPPGRRPSPREPGRRVLGRDARRASARQPAPRRCTSSDRRLPPRPAPFESKATPWPSTPPSSISTSRPSCGCLAKTRREALEQAMTLYRGDLLAGLSVKEEPWEAWAAGRARATSRAGRGGPGPAAGASAQGGPAQGRDRTAHRLLSLDRLQEPVHRTLMRLHAQLGQRGAALRQYQECVNVLQRELGVEPEAETRQLYREILQQRTAGGLAPADPKRRDEQRRPPRGRARLRRPGRPRRR